MGRFENCRISLQHTVVFLPLQIVQSFIFHSKWMVFCQIRSCRVLHFWKGVFIEEPGLFLDRCCNARAKVSSNSVDQMTGWGIKRSCACRPPPTGFVLIPIFVRNALTG